MKVKVNFKKPTVLLTTEKYSSMLAEIDDLRGALEIAKKNSTLREMGWQMLHDQIDELKRKNRGLQAENLEAHALIAELNDQIAASESALDDAHGDLVFQEGLQKDCEAYITELKFQVNMLTKRLEESESRRDHNATLYETAAQAATELAEKYIQANEEAKAARVEAEDIKLELMDREFRINELEKQVEWLRDKNEEWAQIANDQKNTIINYEAALTAAHETEKENVQLKLECDRWKKTANENVEMAKDFHCQATEAEVRAEGLRKTIDEIYEKEADFCAEAQFERERADQLEEANKKLYAQVLAQRDAIERLQCQRAADEEDYNTLKGMYDELHMAAQDLVTRIRK